MIDNRKLRLFAITLGCAPLFGFSGCSRGSSPLAAERDRISTAVSAAGNAGASYVTVHSPSGTYNIVQLTFREGSLDNRHLKYLEGLTPIIGLDLSGTRVTDRGMPIVRSLTNLEYLQLSGTSISDDGLTELAGLEHLEAIDLSHTRVTQSGAKHLQAMPKLKKIFAVGTGLKDVAGKEVEHTKTPNAWIKSWSFDHDAEWRSKSPPEGQTVVK